MIGHDTPTAGVDLTRRGSARQMRMAEVLGTTAPPPPTQKRADLNRRKQVDPEELLTMLAELDAGDAEARADAARIRRLAADALARARRGDR